MATTLAVPVVPELRSDVRPDDDESPDESDNDALITQALNPDGTPRRPMNAFMIFARRRRPEITANNPPLRTGEISKVLSSEWAAMSTESKQFYLDRARKLKDNFNARWPDYVYRRRPNNSRKRKRPEAANGPVRRCPSPGPVVPSSKIKYEDGYHPVVPSVGAPLTMMYLSEAEHGRPGMLGQYSGAPLPSLMTSMPYNRGTPSLASSILTSASASPRSVSSSLYHHVPLTNSPPAKVPRGLDFQFNSPYGLGYLPKSIDDYREPDRHADWTPPHQVRNLSLPYSQPYGAFEPAVDDGSSGSDFHSYHGSDTHLDYSPADTGLIPGHSHFQRS